MHNFGVAVYFCTARELLDNRYVTFQMAEVLVSRSLFYEILERIKHLKPIPIGYD